MEPISYPILGVSHVAPKEFVQFWERFYFGYDENFYRENIGQPLTEKRIADWFEWKNGKPLSRNASQTIKRYSSAKERICDKADALTLAEFLNRQGGPIWRIFWLHLQHPKVFPIYDQHVHRAMAILLKWAEIELPSYNPKKVRIYLGEYHPFFKQFEGCEHRPVDRALWTFGQLLGRNPRLASWLTSGPASEGE
ncbi:MAG: hypothetical protein ACYC3I_02960 [Gemmataceae bacterium]